MMAPDQELVVYDSLEKACNDPQVDGLIICTLNYSHIDVVRIATQSGKHIMLDNAVWTNQPPTIQDVYQVSTDHCTAVL